MAACPNICLVLSGHARGVSRAVFSYDDDRDGIADRNVYALMYDLQLKTDRHGYIRILSVDASDGTLYVTTYSPYFDDEIYDKDHPETDRFVLPGVFHKQ